MLKSIVANDAICGNGGGVGRDAGDVSVATGGVGGGEVLWLMTLPMGANDGGC